MLKLTMTCGPYDRARPLIDKRVQPEGIELDVDVNALNPGFRLNGPHGRFDVVEFYTGQYIADLPNQAINHAATFVEAAADIAVAAVGALPPLGFIHEESSNAFVLDIADLWRAEATVPLAFAVARKVIDDPQRLLERELRLEAARWFRKQKLIPAMICRIKELLHVDDGGGNP